MPLSENFCFQILYFHRHRRLHQVKKRDDKDSNTGIAFVKYTKASEAAKAIEELNGKVLPSSPKPLKVMVAMATKHGTGKDSVSEEELIRLFIRVCRMTA